MALTPEQIREIRLNAGLPAELPAVDPGITRNRLAEFDSAVNKAQTTPDNPIQGIANDAYKTLIAKPATRLSQGLAAGAGALIGGETGKRLQDEANKDMVVPSPFGKPVLVEGQKAFGEGGARQIASDAAKSASYLAPVGGAGAIASKVAGGKILGAAASGAVTGGLSGAAGGLGEGLADPEKGALEVAGDTALGGAVGAAAGGLLGASGAAIGKSVQAVRQAKTPEAKLRYVTPTSTEIPTEEFKNLVNQGRIAPKTLTKPATYILSPSEREVALKYHDVLDKEPVTTAINLGNKLGELDTKVGEFLETNNGIYNRGELRNHLDDVLADVEDINIPEERIAKAKDNIVKRFVDSVEKNDMKGLWKARKEYDKDIEKAFQGSPTLQKEIKIKLRNAVQEFIADHTPEGEYQAFMHDMTNLFDLRDVVDVKAAKGRGLDELRQWVKDNPRTAKVLGISAAALGLGVLGTAGANIVHAGGE